MGRSDFLSKKFTCCLCGTQFEVLTSGQAVADPVCMSCGLRYAHEKRRELIAQRKKTRGSR